MGNRPPDSHVSTSPVLSTRQDTMVSLGLDDSVSDSVGIRLGDDAHRCRTPSQQEEGKLYPSFHASQRSGVSHTNYKETAKSVKDMANDLLGIGAQFDRQRPVP